MTGGYELFKSQDSHNYTTENKTIEKEETIEGIEVISINTLVGDIDFKYIDGDVLKLELIDPIQQSEEPIKVKREKDTLKFDINDVDKKINFDIGRSFNNMEGPKVDILIPRTYKGGIDISSAVGNIKGEYSGRELSLSADVGNIDVDINEIESGKITTDMGNIKVKTKESSNLTLDLKTDLGTIKNNLKNIKNLDSDKDTDFMPTGDMKFDVNKGGSLINIESDMGNIEIYN